MNICQEEGCNNITIYRYNQPVRCKEHATQIIQRYGGVFHCQKEGCVLTPFYGYDWSNPIYCKHHKKEDMFYVTYKRCEKEECKQKAIFGMRLEKPKRCREHAEEHMINLTIKPCEKEHCEARAIYGKKYRKPIFCIKHASEIMIYALYITCEKVNCNHKAEYGKKWGYPTCCKQHVSIRDMEYVSYERCREEGCKEKAYYGHVFKLPLRCENHKSEDMTYVMYNLCHEKDCKNKAVYDNKTKKRIFCEEHIIIEEKDEKCEEKEHRNYFLNKDEWINLNTENNLIFYIKNFEEVSDSFNLYGTDNVLIFSWHALERMNEREITKTELFYELHNTPNKITEFDILIDASARILTNNYNIILIRTSEKEYKLVTIWKLNDTESQCKEETVTKIISASQSNKVAKKKDKESQCNGVIKKNEPIKLEYYISKINELKKLSIKNNRINDKINDKINNKYNKNNKKYYLKEFLSEEDEYYSSDTDEYYSDDSNY